MHHSSNPAATISLLGLIAVIGTLCACQPAPEEPQAPPAPVYDTVSAATTPARPPAWRKIYTINNCHVYEVRYGNQIYLLATSAETAGRTPIGVACALERAR